MEIGTAPRPSFAARFLGAGLAVWVLACVAGLGGIAWAASTPGRAAATAPRTWPSGSAITRDRRRSTLLFFAHTQCSCTRASLRELERALARADGVFDPHVIFSGPPEDARSLHALARGIPGVVVLDDDGEPKRFGVETSGQVLVYSPDGALVFRGGITPARGHEGESKGGRALLAVASGGDASASSSDVFGCALFGAEGKP